MAPQTRSGNSTRRVNQDQHQASPEVPSQDPMVPQLAMAVTKIAQILENQSQSQPARNLSSEKDSNRQDRVGNLEKFLNHRPPIYKGEPDVDKAEEWLSRLEKIFEVMGCREEDRVAFAAYQLEAEAEDWWKNVSKRQEIVTWKRFARAFKESYISEVVKEGREEEFIGLNQGNLSVASYEAKFNKLARYAPYMVKSPAKRIRKFLRGLRSDYQVNLAAHRFDTYGDAVQAALRIEKRKAEIVERQNQKRANINMQARAEIRNVPAGGAQDTSKVNMAQGQQGPICAYCGREGHTDSQCWRKTGNCLVCGSNEHRARDCPKGRNPPSTANRNTVPRAQVKVFALEEEEVIPEDIAVEKGDM